MSSIDHNIGFACSKKLSKWPKMVIISLITGVDIYSGGNEFSEKF
jgi:hypothetical protein